MHSGTVLFDFHRGTRKLRKLAASPFLPFALLLFRYPVFYRQRSARNRLSPELVVQGGMLDRYTH